MTRDAIFPTDSMPKSFNHCLTGRLLVISWPATMWGSAILNGPRLSVRLSVCHTRISPKLSEIDAWLLGNSNRNPGFPIQNLPSDSRSEVRFRHFGCFRVGNSPIQTEVGSGPSEWISGNSHQSRHSTGTACFVVYIVIHTASLKEKENTTTLGTASGQLSSRPITDDTLLQQHLTYEYNDCT